MGTTAQKLQAVLDSKNAIKTALESHGKAPTDVMSTYAGLIEAIPKLTLQSKTATLDTSTTSVALTPDSGYNGLSKATVSITTQTKTKSITSGSATVTPDSGKVLSKVTISGPANRAGTTVEASAVTSDADYTYFGIPSNGYYTTASKVKAANSNLTNVYDLGNGTSFNIPSLLPNVDYTKLTADNFVVEIKTITASVVSRYVNNASASPVSSTISKSYNASTGVLTIGNTSATVTAKTWDNIDGATSTASMTFNVKLITNL